MGTDDLFKRKIEFKRKQDSRQKRKSILIVCEGEKTEPNYFDSFRITSMTVKVIGTGRNTKSLVTYALEQKELEAYEQVWCVFDRDSFSKNDFNTALKMAKENNIDVAYSNEAFELWYVLHFEYLNTGIDRKQYSKKLSQCLRKKYEKNDKYIYEALLDKQKTAMRNTKKLLKQYDSVKPADNNPSTTVHLLVEELNKYLK